MYYKTLLCINTNPIGNSSGGKEYWEKLFWLIQFVIHFHTNSLIVVLGFICLQNTLHTFETTLWKHAST